MVLYSKCAYGSQFSGEKNDLKIRSLVAEILSKNPVLFFLGHPVLVATFMVCNLFLTKTESNQSSFKIKFSYIQAVHICYRTMCKVITE